MSTEKIAVIADVHANRYALQAFLAYLDTTDIARVWNLGDFLQIGPHPAEVADLVLNDSRFITVLGNNEQALLHRNQTAFPAGEVAHQDWTIAQLGEERMARISQLPGSRRLAMGGKRVLLTHEKLLIDAEMSGVDVICCGHTHWPSYEMDGTVGIMNPGSLGFSCGHSLASFAVVTFNEASMRVQYHAMPYDRAMLKQEYFARHVPDRERIFSMFELEG